MQEMGGARNGKFFKWGFLVLLFLTTVYTFYLYRNVKGVLLQRETTLDDMNMLHTRMTEELKDLVKSHSDLQEEVRHERGAHQKTRLSKDALGKECETNIKKLKDSHDQERFRLTQERDSFKQAAEDEQNNHRQLQEKYNALSSRYESELSGASLLNKQLKDKATQCQEQIDQLKKDAGLAQGSIQRWQTSYQQCSSQLQSLEQSLSMKTSQNEVVQKQLVDTASVAELLRNQLLAKGNEVQSMQSQLQQVQELLRDLKMQQAVEKEKHQQPSPPPPQHPLTDVHQNPSNDREHEAKKRALYHQLMQKQAMSGKLDSKELRVLSLLKDEYRGGGRGGGGGGGGGALSQPDMNLQQNRARFGAHYNPGGEGHPQNVQQAKAFGGTFQTINQQQQQSQEQLALQQLQQHQLQQQQQQQLQQQQLQKQVNPGMGMGEEQPGVRMRQEIPRMGMRQDTQEKQQLPEQADQEEVKELKIEGDGKEKEEEREGEGEEGEEREDDGVGDVAFNPEEVKGKKEGEEDGREYDYHEDHPDNLEEQQRESEKDRPRAKENLNLPNPAVANGNNNPRFPDPAHVRSEDNPPQIKPAPAKFENPDQAFDDYNMNRMGDKDDREEDGDKEGGDDYEDDGKKQFEADVNYFQKVRAQGKEGKRGGLDEAMRQGMNQREQKKEEAVKAFEQQQQMEVQKKFKLQQEQPQQDNVEDLPR